MNRAPNALEMRQWSEAVARDPGSLAFLPLAEAYGALGRLDAAVRLCQRGLDRHPHHLEAWLLLARLLRDKGTARQAIAALERVLDLNPDHPVAHRELGLLYLAREEWEHARMYLEAAARLDPDGQDLQDALATLRASAPEKDLESVLNRLKAPVDRLVEEARLSRALLIDASGRVHVQRGFRGADEVMGFAALGAGVHASSRALARLLRQDGFDHLHQDGGREQIFIGPFATPAGDLILLGVLAEGALLGRVRLAFGSFVQELAVLPGWRHLLPRPSADRFEQNLHAALDRALR